MSKIRDAITEAIAPKLQKIEERILSGGCVDLVEYKSLVERRKALIEGRDAAIDAADVDED